MPLWRNQHAHVYFICQRCGFRQPLSHMRWQNGLLVCQDTNCVDKAILGKRDVDVDRALSIDRHELEPDPKLTTPIERKNDQLDVLY